MLSIVLKILFILGILLLCILGLAIAFVLLVLFFPICYKISGKKDTEQMSIHVRASWLLGFLRVCFDYPDPGKLLIKLLFFTVFDSGKESGGKAEKDSKGNSVKAAKKKEKRKKHRKRSEAEEDQRTAAGEGQKSAVSLADEGATPYGPPTESGIPEKEHPAQSEEKRPQPTVEQEQETNPEKTQHEQTNISKNESGNSEPEQEMPEDSPFFFQKFKKIKYTIRSIYDKIKNIWENISYYIELLKEKETKELFSHVVFRVGKILKNIRPRHVKGQILFGTGSPDTTGYAYGIYGMLMPHLGDRLLVTPDFTRAVLEGDIYIAGHITAFTIIWNGLRLLLDRKFKRFIKKIRAGRKM